MSYTEHIPAQGLQDHIAAYWIRKTSPTAQPSSRRVYADGCADLILNAGNNTAFFNPMVRAEEMIPLYPGRLYLGGTMTAYGVVHSEPGCTLIGIRFRPGGFYTFFGLPMEPAVDTLLEFHDNELHGLMQKENGLPYSLDSWFAKKTIAGDKKHNFAALHEIAHRSGGQISVESLAAAAHVSNRTLERIFKENVGIPPKEFLRIIRFQEVLRQLRHAGTPGSAMPGTTGAASPHPHAEESLLRIAFDLGYYDHAHLTNEFKKYAGILPSELSHFYKTGIAGSQYF
jgi:AraC-like DNA-binding protein